MNASLRINSILNIIRSMLNVIFPLVTFKYASNVLGPDGIGAANYTQSVISYFQLIATFGIATYAVAEGSKVRNDKQKLATFVNEMLTFNLLTTVIAYLLIAVLAYSNVFGNHCILILVFSSTLLFTAVGVEWLYNINEQFKYITLRSFVIQCISLIALFLFVRDKDDLLVYIALVAFSSVGSSICNYFKARTIYNFGIVPLSSLRKYTLPLFVIFGTSIASLIYVNSDIIIIELMKNDEVVGIYSAAVKIVKVLCVPIASVGAVALPQISENIKLGNTARTEDICMKVLSFMAFFIFPFTIGIFLFAEESVLIISGHEFLEATPAIQIMAVDIILSPLNGFLVSQLLVPLGKQNISLIATIGGAVGNIILDIILIPEYSLYGAAFATVVSELIVFMVCVPTLCRFFNMRNIIGNQWQFLAASIAIIPIVLIVKSLIGNMYVALGLSIIISALAYFAILLLLHNNVVIEISTLITRKLNKHG